MSVFVMSDKYPEFVDGVKALGHRVIASDTIEALPLPEQKHADMQVLPINNEVFILRECTKLRNKLRKSPIITQIPIGGKYPENILLNFLYLKGCLFGNKRHIDISLREYCVNNNINIVNVNQGYCRCSTLVVSENAVITADISIENALKSKGAEVLKISPGHIALEGFDYGFIGGAAGAVDGNTIVFFGNVKNHPDFDLIDAFCKKHGKNITVIGESLELTDIGGIVKAE